MNDGHVIRKILFFSSIVLLALVDMKMLFSQRLFHDLLVRQHHEALAYTGKRINMAQFFFDLTEMFCNDLE